MVDEKRSPDLVADIFWGIVEKTWRSTRDAFNARFVVCGVPLPSHFDPSLVPLYEEHCVALLYYAERIGVDPRMCPHYLAMRQLLLRGYRTDAFRREMVGFPELPSRDDLCSMF